MNVSLLQQRCEGLVDELRRMHAAEAAEAREQAARDEKEARRAYAEAERAARAEVEEMMGGFFSELTALDGFADAGGWSPLPTYFTALPLVARVTRWPRPHNHSTNLKTRASDPSRCLRGASRTSRIRLGGSWTKTPDGSPAWIWPLAQARVDGTECCITVQASSTRTALFLLLNVEFAATATAACSHHVFTTSFISLFFNKGRWAKPHLSSSIRSASQSHSPDTSAGAGPVEQQHRAKWFDFRSCPMPLVLASAAARRFFDDDCTTVSSLVNPRTSS